MAVKGKSSADRTARWEVLVTNLKPSVPDMPHVADDLKNLEELLAQARALETQQADQRSQVRKSSAQLRKILRDGDQVRARLGAVLKGKFGFTDEGLGKFGFKPVATKGRKRKSGTPQPPAPSGAQGTPAANHPATPATPAQGTTPPAAAEPAAK